MTAIQEISARIGRVTGIGIAANLRKYYPKPVLYCVLIVVSVPNVFNLGADIGAMAAAAQLVVPGKVGVFTVIFGVASLAGVLLVPYSTYAEYLKWLTLSLFAYVAVVFCVHRVMARGGPRDRAPAHSTHKKIPNRADCRARDHHQSLPVLLAGFARSRRGEEQSRRETVEACSFASAGAAGPHPYRYLFRYVIL
jgi:hypothetical protein